MPTDHRSRLVRAAKEAETAAEALTQAIKDAQAAGVSWAEMAEDTGLTKSALRWRAGALDEAAYVKERRTDAVERGEAQEAERVADANTSQIAEPVGTTLVTLARAAEMLRLSRTSLYEWIESGRIPLTTNGKRRAVAVDPETGRIAVAIKGTYPPLPTD